MMQLSFYCFATRQNSSLDICKQYLQLTMQQTAVDLNRFGLKQGVIIFCKFLLFPISTLLLLACNSMHMHGYT